MALCPCISISALLFLPRGLRPLWHYPFKGRQKKEPPFFASIILRISPREGTKDHPSFALPAPRNPPPFAVSGERAGGGEVRGVCQIPAPARFLLKGKIIFGQNLKPGREAR